MEFEPLSFETEIAALERRVLELQQVARPDEKVLGEIESLREEIRQACVELYRDLDIEKVLQVARYPGRPTSAYYIERLFQEFFELHGDRRHGDDPSVIAGPAFFRGRAVMVVGQERGATREQRLKCREGMTLPEGFRKTRRLMHLAARFRLPLIAFVDTPGAYPGIEAETRSISHAIAANLMELQQLEVPVISVVHGEGGSGGALALATGDHVIMLSNAIYSVISPEGCASILWRDPSRAPEAAQSLRIRAHELKDLGLIDEVLPEPPGGAHRYRSEVAATLEGAMESALRRLEAQPADKRLAARRERYRQVGDFVGP